jgi:hypothetical protein
LPSESTEGASLNTTVRHRLLAAVLGVVVLAGATAGGCGSPAEEPSNPPVTEQEDCDAEDRLEGDSDCEDGESSKFKIRKKKSDKANSSGATRR